MTLFRTEHLQPMLEANLRTAMATLNNFTLQQLSDPALAGKIEQLWASYRPNVPVLCRADKYGERRETTRRRNDHGRDITVQVTVVDVLVPYRGDERMFRVTPSSSAILNEQVQVRGGCLHYEMPLDPAQEPRFEKLLDQIEQNLDTMRREEEAFSKNALIRLNVAAAERRKKLEDDDKTAGSFSFKVK